MDIPNIDNCTITERGSGYKVEANEGFALFRVSQYQRWLEKSAEDSVAYPPEDIGKHVRFFKVAYLAANSDGSSYDTIELNENIKI
jgi:hypothetical protein